MGSPGRALSWLAMVDDAPTEAFRRHQADLERAERKEAAEAMTEAEAEVHRRRSEKAGYLRSKLAERELADEQARDDGSSGA